MRGVRKAVSALVLAPGATASRDQSALVAIDDALAPEGVRVERIDFPCRLAGRRAPDRQPVLVASVVAAARKLADDLAVPQVRIALGGRSMGGRMCSIAVAEGLPAAALVLVSYPLHPPGDHGALPVRFWDTRSLRHPRGDRGGDGCHCGPGDPCPCREGRPRASQARRRGGDHRRQLGACPAALAQGPAGALPPAIPTGVRRELPRPRPRGPHTPPGDRSSPRSRRPRARSPPGRRRWSTKRRWL